VEVDMPLLLDRLTARRTCRGCGAIFNVISQPEAASGVCSQCGGELYQRDDDTVETVSNRLAVYERNTAPLIEYYRERGLLRPVDGNQPVDDVFAAIQTVVEA
jgi:adenylate kinase